MTTTLRLLLALCLGQPAKTGVNLRLTRFGAVVVVALLSGLAQAPKPRPRR